MLSFIKAIIFSHIEKQKFEDKNILQKGETILTWNDI